jgi:hypothetical protein
MEERMKEKLRRYGRERGERKGVRQKEDKSQRKKNFESFWRSGYWGPQGEEPKSVEKTPPY